MMPAVVPLILAGVSAGAEVYAANKQANTAQQAAQTQANYGQKALDLQRSVFNQQQQNLSPYLQAGQSVLGTLPQLAQQRPSAFVPGAPQPPMAPPMPMAPSWNTPWQGSPR